MIRSSASLLSRPDPRINHRGEPLADENVHHLQHTEPAAPVDSIRDKSERPAPVWRLRQNHHKHAAWAIEMFNRSSISMRPTSVSVSKSVNAMIRCLFNRRFRSSRPPDLFRCRRPQPVLILTAHLGNATDRMDIIYLVDRRRSGRDNGNDGVVTVQPFRRENMSLEPSQERLQRDTAGAHPVG